MQTHAENFVKVMDFTSVPGARYRQDGDGSAEAFFEDCLKEAFDKSLAKQELLTIDFDGTWGYASSFISELARKLALFYSQEQVRQYLRFKSDDEPTLIDRLKNELSKDYNDQVQGR